MIGRFKPWIFTLTTEETTFYYLEKALLSNPSEEIMTISKGTYVWSLPACQIQGVNFSGTPIPCPRNLTILASDIVPAQLTLFLLNPKDR